MKKTFLLSTRLVALFALFSFNASAQNKKNVVKAKLFGVFAGQYQLSMKEHLIQKALFS
jgi:hypothetical protein